MGLSFLSPLLLAGAALVAVPIVLHLIMRREPKHLVFPAMQFIQRREESNRRRLRLRHLLLLLLRCAGIVLLALALARPSLKSAGFMGDQEAPIAAALVFDTGVRMDYQHENRTRLQAAQETALWLLPQLPAESEIAVVDRSSLAGTFAVDLAAARHRIERLATAASAQPWLDVVESALRLVQDSQKERKEIYLFTDLARGSWPPDAIERFRSRLEPYRDIAIYIIDVGVTNPQNFSVGDIRLSSQTVAERSSVRLRTELNRIGPSEQRDVAIYVADRSGQFHKRGERSFKWEDGQSTSAEFELPAPALGTQQGMIKLVGDDALAADNIRYFTFEVRPPWKLLIAAPPDATTMWLERALAPQKQESRFQVKTIALDVLAAEPLDDYAAVCLLDPTPLAPAVWYKLRDFASYGGGVAIWLGRGAAQGSTTAENERFNTAAALEVIPGKLTRQARSTGDLYLAPPDLQHPTLRGFQSVASAVPWASFPVFKYWQLDDLKEGVHVVIPYSNGRPALLEQAMGHGRVLTMTTPISHAADEIDPWNVLATGFGNWPFFVLTQEMGAYLVGSGAEQFNYQCGDAAVLQLPEHQRSLIFTLHTPHKIQIPQTVDQGRGTLTATATDEAGNYQLHAGGSEGGVRRGFSANIPAAATRLDRVAKEDLDALFGDDRYRLARDRDEITRDVHLGRVGVELYPLLIVLVALVLGAEHVLANRFYHRNVKVPLEAARTSPLASTAAAG